LGGGGALSGPCAAAADVSSSALGWGGASRRDPWSRGHVTASWSGAGPPRRWAPGRCAGGTAVARCPDLARSAGSPCATLHRRTGRAGSAVEVKSVVLRGSFIW